MSAQVVTLLPVACPACGAARRPVDASCDACGTGMPGGGWWPDALVGRDLPDPPGWRLGARLEATRGRVRYRATRRGPDDGTPVEGVVEVIFAADAQPDARRRAAQLAHVRHPHVQPPLGGGLVEGRPYRLEATAVTDLAQALGQRGAMDWQEAVRIVEGLADGLVALHARGLVHGRVGAGTVCLVPGDDGRPSAVLARFPTSVVGEPSPGAPEVDQGSQPDPRADLFGLGLVLLSLLRGAAAEPDRDTPEWRTCRPGPAVSPPEHRRLPPELLRLCLTLVDRDPDARPLAATEAREHLRRLRPGEAPPRGPGTLRQALPWMVAVGATTVALGLAVVLLATGPTPGEPEVADAAPFGAQPVQPEAPPGGPPDGPRSATADPTPTGGAAPHPAPSQAGPLPPASPVGTAVGEATPVADLAPPADLAHAADLDPAADLAPAAAAAAAASPPVPAPPATASAAPPSPAPEPEAPAAPAPLTGVWQGTVLGRPATFELTTTADGLVSGTVTLRLGAEVETLAVTGSVTAADEGTWSVRLVEHGPRPRTYMGQLSGRRIAGAVNWGGRDRGAFNAVR